MTVIVTANFGDYDISKTHTVQTVECSMVEIMESIGEERHPRLAAKEPKLRPWDYTHDLGPWIWIDGSFEIVSPTFVDEVLDACDGAEVAQWTHPARDCIYQEANASTALPKYAGVPIDEQVAHYRSIGHPTRWGLWAAGLIVYRQRCDYLADLWSAEINRWGVQDQISEPVALRAAGMRPAALPHSLHRNPWLRQHPHRDGTC
jgi:hypothetical protein